MEYSNQKSSNAEYQRAYCFKCFSDGIDLQKLLGSRARSAAALVSPPRAQVCSGLLLRPREPDLEDDESADEAMIAWKVWMKESITVAEG